MLLGLAIMLSELANIEKKLTNKSVQVANTI